MGMIMIKMIRRKTTIAIVMIIMIMMMIVTIVMITIIVMIMIMIIMRRRKMTITMLITTLLKFCYQIEILKGKAIIHLDNKLIRKLRFQQIMKKMMILFLILMVYLITVSVMFLLGYLVIVIVT